MLELTEQQQLAVKNGEPVVVPSKELGDVVVICAKHLEMIREALADHGEQKAVLEHSMNMARKSALRDPY
jgi:PHD/YefM family antitoxin component YafN of YafNO toxin-antitoxin module